MAAKTVTIVEAGDDAPNYWGYAFPTQKQAVAFRRSLPGAIVRPLMDALAFDNKALGRVDQSGILDRTFGGVVGEGLMRYKFVDSPFPVESGPGTGFSRSADGPEPIANSQARDRASASAPQVFADAVALDRIAQLVSNLSRKGPSLKEVAQLVRNTGRYVA